MLTEPLFNPLSTLPPRGIVPKANVFKLLSLLQTFQWLPTAYSVICNPFYVLKPSPGPGSLPPEFRLCPFLWPLLQLPERPAAPPLGPPSSPPPWSFSPGVTSSKKVEVPHHCEWGAPLLCVLQTSLYSWMTAFGWLILLLAKALECRDYVLFVLVTELDLVWLRANAQCLVSDTQCLRQLQPVAQSAAL